MFQGQACAAFSFGCHSILSHWLILVKNSKQDMLEKGNVGKAELAFEPKVHNSATKVLVCIAELESHGHSINGYMLQSYWRTC